MLAPNTRLTRRSIFSLRFAKATFGQPTALSPRRFSPIYTIR